MPFTWNLGILTSWKPLGHPRPLTGLLYHYLYKLTNTVWKQTILCSLWPTCQFGAVRQLVTTWPLSICTPCTYASQSARGWVYELWSAVGGDFGLSCWMVRDLWLLRNGVKVIECSISQTKLDHLFGISLCRLLRLHSLEEVECNILDNMVRLLCSSRWHTSSKLCFNGVNTFVRWHFEIYNAICWYFHTLCKWYIFGYLHIYLLQTII